MTIQPAPSAFDRFSKTLATTPSPNRIKTIVPMSSPNSGPFIIISSPRYFAASVILCDAKTLEDAKIHPGDHRDLMVRVAGYSTYFVQLTPGLQDEAIARTDHMLYES